MAQRAFINACFHLFFVVLVVAALTQSSCIDEIREVLMKSRGMLLGGYRAIENPEDDDNVKGIVASALNWYNQQSNDVHFFGLFENEMIEAYQQLVNGQNFCVQFTAVSIGCKNKIYPFFCRDGKKVVCSVEAYKSFKENEARIYPETVACKTKTVARFDK